MVSIDDELNRLHVELGMKRLSPIWAKVEIVLGLLTAAVGLLYGGSIVVQTPSDYMQFVIPAVLFMLGGYLALAGHRSHLYQSNNRLAAYLAGLIRSSGNHP